MKPDLDTGAGTQCFDITSVNSIKISDFTSERKVDKLVTASLNKGRFAANDVGKAKPLRFSGKPQDTGKNCFCKRCELSVPCLFCRTLSGSG